MEIYRELKANAKPEDWGEGVQWLICGVFGLLPLWGLLLVLSLLKQSLSISAFMDHGEFALYSASYIGGAIYVVMKDFIKSPFPSRRSLMSILVAALLLSTAIYVVISVANVLSNLGGVNPLTLLNVRLVRILSCGTLFVSAAAAFFVVVAETTMTSPGTILQARQNNFANLNKNFDDLEGGSK